MKNRRASDLMYTPQHVANFFLLRARKEGRGVSPIKLIKLVYIAYGWVLALTGEKLFDEEIEAWQHGPVVQSLYHEFKHFGSSDITEFATTFDLDTFDSKRPEIAHGTQEELVLEKVWETYKWFTGWALRNKTHLPDSPWSSVYRDGERNIVIPDDTIKEHFETRIGQYLDAAGTKEN